MSDMQVQAELTLKDNMTKPAAKGLEAVAKSADKLQQSGRQRGPDGRFLKQMAADGTEAARSMDAVGRETQQLQQQLKGADRSGSALRRTLNGVRDAGRDAAKHMAQMGKGLSAAGGGAMAAGYVAKTALEKPMEYEAQLLDMANTAFNHLNSAGRIKAAKGVDSTVTSTVRAVGGSREQALAGYNAFAAGGVESDDIKKLLPVLQKAVVATKADPKELAQVLIKGINAGLITVAEAELALDKATKAGQLGKFEIKDMSRWLPQAFNAGKGMKNMGGFDQHLANLQAVEAVSANADQAGNAYFNFLGKLSAPETIRAFKDRGVNLDKIKLNAVKNGIDPVTAVGDAIEKNVLGKSKKYKQLKAQLDAAKDGDAQKEIIEQMMDIMQGSVLAKLFPDREAMTGLIGVISQKEIKAKVLEGLKNAKGTVKESHATVASGTGYKAQQAANEKDIAMSATFDRIKTPLDATLERSARFAQENPVLATATAGTATLGGIATAGGTAWGGMKLLQGTKPAADAGTAIAPARGGLAGTAAKVASKAALPLAMGGAAYEIYSTENDATKSRDQKNIANMQTYGGFGGMLAGAAMGGVAGSVVPILGNGIGAILGGLAGYFAGGQAGKGVGELAWGTKDESTPENAPQLPDANIKQDINLTVELDGQKVAEILERRQSRESLRQ